MNTPNKILSLAILLSTAASLSSCSSSSTTPTAGAQTPAVNPAQTTNTQTAPATTSVYQGSGKVNTTTRAS